VKSWTPAARQPITGADFMRALHGRLTTAQYCIYHAIFPTDFAGVLSSAGRIDEALAVVKQVKQTLGLIEKSQAFWYCWKRCGSKVSCCCCKMVRARSWELHAASSVAQLLRNQGRSADALARLQPVYGLAPVSWRDESLGSE
jgi:hypothetical protein